MSLFGWLKKPANTETVTALACAAVASISPAAAALVRVAGSAIEEVEAKIGDAPGDQKKQLATSLIQQQAPDAIETAAAAPNAPPSSVLLSDVIDALVALYHALGVFKRKKSTPARPTPGPVSAK